MSRPIDYKVWDYQLGKIIPLTPFLSFDSSEYAFLQYSDKKDSDGIKLYDGDIFEEDNNCPDNKFEIVFLNGSWCAMHINCRATKLLHSQVWSSIKKIGSRYETPNLITRKCPNLLNS